MDLEKILKQLNAIEPDSVYAKNSRRLILHAKENARLRPFGVMGLVMRLIENGSAIALASVLLVIVIGGFSINYIFSPLRLTGLNFESLKAEADAIDIQIRLADLSYQERGTENGMASLEHPTTTVKIIEPSLDIKMKLKEEAEQLGLTSTPSSTELITIDEALRRLGE